MNFINANEISKELQISRSSAYKIIRKLNHELEEKGYLVVNGKVPKRYFVLRYYIEPDEMR